MSESEDPAPSADPDDRSGDAAEAAVHDGNGETGTAESAPHDGNGENSAPGVAPHDGDGEAALQDLPDGSGCAEIWDYLSERRRRD